jgi:hypothetical protein
MVCDLFQAIDAWGPVAWGALALGLGLGGFLAYVFVSLVIADARLRKVSGSRG